jgi:hypothetical protein
LPPTVLLRKRQAVGVSEKSYNSNLKSHYTQRTSVLQ